MQTCKHDVHQPVDAVMCLSYYVRRSHPYSATNGSCGTGNSQCNQLADGSTEVNLVERSSADGTFVASNPR